MDFAVESLPLTPGDYEVTVAISDEFVQHNFDRHEREYHLRVRSGADRQTPEGRHGHAGALVRTSGDRTATGSETVRR